MMKQAASIIARALEFNLQADARVIGGYDQLIRTARHYVPWDIVASLSTFGLSVELLVERSLWTCRCDGALKSHGPASDPQREELYCVCFRFFRGSQPIFASDLRGENDATFVSGYSNYRQSGALQVLHGARVFIAYSGQRQLLVLQIRMFLEQFGVDVWDYKHSDTSDIEAGSRLLPSLQRQIDAAHAVIVIDDGWSQQSVWTTAEILHAIGRDRDRVIPIRVADQYTDGRAGDRRVELTHYNWSSAVVVCICHWPERLWELAACVSRCRQIQDCL